MQTHQPDRQFLFICGTARSGTTALTRVLNAHEHIGIGMERFKQITRGHTRHLLTPELFDEERFFDFTDAHTNMTPSKSDAMQYYYDTLHAKWSGLSYIGDKVPNSFRTVSHVHQNFPRTKHVFIVRDIFQTACSWHTRAKKPGDAWAEHKDANFAVYPWNETIHSYLDLKREHPDDFYLVDYHRFFDAVEGDVAELVRLCDFLDITMDESMRDTYIQAQSHHHQKVKTKSRELDAENMAYILEHADLEAYREATGRLPDELPSMLASKTGTDA
ncbi:sulfotransferase family protein [Granulosicoccus sp. 3-233]|uniref:sulfotransferase family protein n=1 Tax=Granulosicoccus sp. 3-233 TaxID=3417969 RepID=UPI003D34EA19